MRSRALLSSFLCLLGAAAPGARGAAAAVGAVAAAACAAVVSLAACDSGEESTPPSAFPTEDTLGRAIGGRVFRGPEPAVGASLRLDPTPGFGSDAELAVEGDPAWTLSTDAAGAYRFRKGPLRYDLSVRVDQDLTVFQDLRFRYFEPALAQISPVRGFTTRVALAIDPPPAPDHALAFFVSGGDARTSSGDQSSLEVVFRQYQTVITVYAIEYVARDGLAAAVAESRAEVRVQSGVGAAAALRLQPIAAPPSELAFDTAVPDGFTPSPLEIIMDHGLPTSQVPVTSLPPGTPFRFTRVSGARYLVRARATRPDGASTDTGQRAFDPALPRVALTLPAPATRAVLASADVGAPLVASGGGVYEHALEPVSGLGPHVRIVTSSNAVLPDATKLGMSPARGAHVWTVTRWSDLERTEDLSGPEARATRPSATTAPVTLDLR